MTWEEILRFLISRGIEVVDNCLMMPDQYISEVSEERVFRFKFFSGEFFEMLPALLDMRQ